MNRDRPGLAHRKPVPLAQLPPLSLYVHLPWCVKKCPYCDFNSHERRTCPRRLPRRAARRPRGALPLVWGRTVQTVFIGGGTPSLFSAEAIDRC
jgi:coproporphyrinogen III oxidase-like Fe-S oxidoreductase